eukprot:GEMP01094155.1.p1 GENE.GEMP01094155.1~~GEMP01094155.1.p1  ORF type:complete len:106 (-),score=0.36 GEMP01094155.1:8-325(-)
MGVMPTNPCRIMVQTNTQRKKTLWPDKKNGIPFFVCRAPPAFSKLLVSSFLFVFGAWNQHTLFLIFLESPHKWEAQKVAVSVSRFLFAQKSSTKILAATTKIHKE